MDTNRHGTSALMQSTAIQLGLLFFIIMTILGCNLSSNPDNAAKKPSPIAPMPLASATTRSASELPSSPPAASAVWEGGTETVNPPAFSGTPQVSYWFTGEECGCATFPAVAEASYGPGVLECRYAWGGEYIDDNSISFSVIQYHSQVDLDREFTEQLGWMQDAAQDDKSFIDSGSLPQDEQYIARNETNGFSFVTTGPGGGSSKTNTEIPMCGNGGGILRVYGKFLVKIRLFACDLGDDRQVYQTTIETLEDCALHSIDQAMSTKP